MITLFLAGSARSGRLLSSAFGFPPGHPVIVFCSLLNILILISYAGPESANKSLIPFSM